MSPVPVNVNPALILKVIIASILVFMQPAMEDLAVQRFGISPSTAFAGFISRGAQTAQGLIEASPTVQAAKAVSNALAQALPSAFTLTDFLDSKAYHGLRGYTTIGGPLARVPSAPVIKVNAFEAPKPHKARPTKQSGAGRDFGEGLLHITLKISKEILKFLIRKPVKMRGGPIYKERNHNIPFFYNGAALPDRRKRLLLEDLQYYFRIRSKDAVVSNKVAPLYVNTSSDSSTLLFFGPQPRPILPLEDAAIPYHLFHIVPRVDEETAAPAVPYYFFHIVPLVEEGLAWESNDLIPLPAKELALYKAPSSLFLYSPPAKATTKFGDSPFARRRAIWFAIIILGYLWTWPIHCDFVYNLYCGDTGRAFDENGNYKLGSCKWVPKYRPKKRRVKKGGKRKVRVQADPATGGSVVVPPLPTVAPKFPPVQLNL